MNELDSLSCIFTELNIPWYTVEEQSRIRVYRTKSTSHNNITIQSDDNELNVRVYYCDDFGWTKLDFWKDM